MKAPRQAQRHTEFDCRIPSGYYAYLQLERPSQIALEVRMIRLQLKAVKPEMMP
jgi:hypothetical protein